MRLHIIQTMAASPDQLAAGLQHSFDTSGSNGTISWDDAHRQADWTSGGSIRGLGSMHMQGTLTITPSQHGQSALSLSAQVKGSGLLRLMVPVMVAYGEVSTRRLLRNIDRTIALG